MRSHESGPIPKDGDTALLQGALLCLLQLANTLEGVASKMHH